EAESLKNHRTKQTRSSPCNLRSIERAIPLDSLKSQQYKLLLSCSPGLCPLHNFWPTLTDAGLQEALRKGQRELRQQVPPCTTSSSDGCHPRIPLLRLPHASSLCARASSACGRPPHQPSGGLY